MNGTVSAIIDEIILVEGGYSNHPKDKGGETKYGITKAVAEANGYTGSMKDMPRSLAVSIYRKRYIEVPRFDSVFSLSQATGVEVIDTGVNMGPHRASEFLQRWLNAFNVSYVYGPDLFVDGRIGAASLDMLAKYLLRRGKEGEKVLVRALNCVQGNRYLEITESKHSQREFVYGWIRNRVVV